MAKLSLTDLVDVVSKSGTPKITCVAKIKNRGEYDPKTDFYKPLRGRIADTHRKGQDKDYLKAVLVGLTDKKKQTNYPAAVKGYTKWWGTKALTWFPPSSNLFSGSGVDVNVNPELGLTFGGESHLIKLYFKDEALTNNRIAIIGCLMEECLRPKATKGEKMSILDVRNGKLITPAAAAPGLKAGLQAELAYIAALWPNV